MDHRQVDKRNQLIVLTRIHHAVMVQHMNLDQSLEEKVLYFIESFINIPIVGIDFESDVIAN